MLNILVQASVGVSVVPVLFCVQRGVAGSGVPWSSESSEWDIGHADMHPLLVSGGIKSGWVSVDGRLRRRIDRADYVSPPLDGHRDISKMNALSSLS